MSNSGTLYIGITNNLVRRVWEHKESVKDRKKSNTYSTELTFTARYNIDQLIYYEIFKDAENAILREKQLKHWSRQKKLSLIRKMNPQFKDRYEELV